MTEKEYINKKDHIISNITNGEIKCKNCCLSSKCTICRGFCCNNYPCILSPNEFINIEDIDYMKSILDLGILSIASLNLSDSFYCIRPRGIKDLDCIYTGYVMGPNSCILQTKKGCILDYATRPTEGLLLIPTDSRYITSECKQYYEEDKLVNDWYPYQSLLCDLRKIYKDKEIEKPKPTEELARTYKLKLIRNCKKETN